MKVLHLMPTVKSGGVETTILNSINLLNESINYQVLTLEKNDSENTLKNVTCISGAFRYLSCLINFYRIILNENYDIVVFSLWKSSLIYLLTIPLIKIKKIKSVIFIHSSFFAHLPDKIVTSFSIKLCDQILCDSLSSKKFISNKTNTKCSVISFLSRKLEYKSTKSNNFVFIARLNKSKGVLVAAKLFKEIFKTNANLKFDIYGPDEGDLPNLMKYIRDNNLENIIKYKGEINNKKVPEVLVNYGFYLQPSLKEGMAISVMESMQLGLIPIVYPIGELKYYTKDLVNAVHLDYSNVDLNKEKINRVIMNKEKRKEISINATKEFSNQDLYHKSFLNRLNEIVS